MTAVRLSVAAALELISQLVDVLVGPVASTVMLSLYYIKNDGGADVVT